MRIWLSNVGTRSIGDIWLVSGEDDEYWIDESADQGTGAHQMAPLPHPQPIGEAPVLGSETFDSDNSLLPRTPYRIPWTSVENSALAPGANFELPFVLHASKLGEQELCFLLTFREVCNIFQVTAPL